MWKSSKAYQSLSALGVLLALLDPPESSPRLAPFLFGVPPDPLGLEEQKIFLGLLEVGALMKRLRRLLLNLRTLCSDFPRLNSI
jgi:hypothetical protein